MGGNKLKIKGLWGWPMLHVAQKNTNEFHSNQIPFLLINVVSGSSFFSILAKHLYWEMSTQE